MTTTLDNLTNEMMSAFGGAEGMEGLMAQPDGGDDEQDDGRTATFPFLSQLFGGGSGPSGEPPKGEKNAANGKGERPPKRKFLENYCISLTKKGPGGTAGPAHWPGPGAGAGHSDPQPPAEEQPLPHRRTRCGQDGHRRGACHEDRQG